jgi:hypothetical protein
MPTASFWLCPVLQISHVSQRRNSRRLKFEAVVNFCKRARDYFGRQEEGNESMSRELRLKIKSRVEDQQTGTANEPDPKHLYCQLAIAAQQHSADGMSLWPAC